MSSRAKRLDRHGEWGGGGGAPPHEARRHHNDAGLQTQGEVCGFCSV